MNNLKYAEYLSDDELQKVAPLLKRLKKLEARAESQEDYLSFVKKIIYLHNGTISVSSELGKGSEFKIIFKI